MTKPQIDLLTELMRANGPIVPYGAQFRTAGALIQKGLAYNSRGEIRITAAGLGALEDYRAKQWADYGCMAYLIDLNEVRAALASLRRENAA